LLASSIYLAIACLLMNEPFTGFTDMGWFVLLLQAVVCQLMAWLSISFATQHMRPTRVSLSLLAQAVITALLAWVFLDEKITVNMVIGGLILLVGIRITFYTKTLSIKNLKTNNQTNTAQ
ncbi:MAG: DMT family transporter, partial [Flavobacterium sp.]|nr:DMT family transporter [Flavobacterium sp.]